MSAFRKHLKEVLWTQGGDVYFENLSPLDQRILRSLYLRENEDVAVDVLADIHLTSLANHLADIARYGVCDSFGLARDIEYAIDNSKDLEALIDGEMDILWPTVEAEKRQEKAEALWDQARMH